MIQIDNKFRKNGEYHLGKYLGQNKGYVRWHNGEKNVQWQKKPFYYTKWRTQGVKRMEENVEEKTVQKGWHTGGQKGGENTQQKREIF